MNLTKLIRRENLHNFKEDTMTNENNQLLVIKVGQLIDGKSKSVKNKI